MNKLFRKERYLLMCTECNLFFPPGYFRYHVPQFRMCENCRLFNLDIVNYLERYVYPSRKLGCYTSFQERVDRVHRKCLNLEKELYEFKESMAKRDEEKVCMKIYEVVNIKEEENSGNQKLDLKIKIKVVKKNNNKKAKLEVRENAKIQVSPPKKIKLELMDVDEQQEVADAMEKQNLVNEIKKEKDVDSEEDENAEEMIDKIIDDILKKINDLKTNSEDYEEDMLIMN